MERLPLPFLRPQVRHTLDPNQFVYQEKAGVNNSILYLLHRPYSHLEKRNSAVRIMCVFYYSSATYAILLPLLWRDKQTEIRVTWIMDYLTGRPQYVRLSDCSS